MSWQTRLAQAKGKHKAKNKFGADLTMGKSKLERAVDDILSLREKAGELRNLQRQQTLVLQDGPREMRITWRIDFSFEERHPLHPEYWLPAFAEAKGFIDREYRLKLKLFRAKPQGKLEIWGGTYKYPKLIEVINP